MRQDSGSRVVSLDKVFLQLGNKDVLVDRAKLRGVDGELLAWSWYRIGEFYTSNDYLAKLLEAFASLGVGQRGSFRILVAVPQEESAVSTQALLHDFLATHNSQLDETLRRAMETGQ